MLRSTITAIAISAGCLAAGPGQGESAPDASAKPRVYALVAAIGEELTTISETSTVGSHLSPYRRHTSTVPNNILNRLALHSLDKAVDGIDPASARIYLSLPPAQIDGVTPSKRDSTAIAAVVAQLQEMPERQGWDRILVATPAYRALDRDGMPSKLQGFGIYSAGQCKAGCGGFRDPVPRDLAPEPPDGVEVVTSDDKKIKARNYLAPFSYIEVWVLDPKTLAVLDMQQGFDSQKLAEESHKARLDTSTPETQKYLAMRMVNLIELSVGEAVKRSEASLPRGTVEIGPIREVDPEGTQKK
jgi:hypothetical protein